MLKKIYLESKQKKIDIAILISNIVGFVAKYITRCKADYDIMIVRSVHQKDNNFLITST